MAFLDGDAPDCGEVDRNRHPRSNLSQFDRHRSDRDEFCILYEDLGGDQLDILRWVHAREELLKAALAGRGRHLACNVACTSQHHQK